MIALCRTFGSRSSIVRMVLLVARSTLCLFNVATNLASGPAHPRRLNLSACARSNGAVPSVNSSKRMQLHLVLSYYRKGRKHDRTPSKRHPSHVCTCHPPAHSALAFAAHHLSNSAVIYVPNKGKHTSTFNKALGRNVASLPAARVEEESENRRVVGGQCGRLKRREVSELRC